MERISGIEMHEMLGKVELHWRLQDKDTMEEVAAELERRSDV